MENTSATTLTHHTIHDQRAEQDFPSHWLVAHEAAHQWWGDLVTMRDWSHSWLSESFATYGEHLFARFDLGDDEGAVNLLGKKNRYLGEVRNRYMRPIVFDRWETPQNMFDSHLYPKGAVVLNMLRFVMGDELFRRAMSHFLKKHAFGPADTYDLMKAIKESTGQNQDRFFEQWIFSPGHPVFEVAYDWNADREKLELEIKQTQRWAAVPIFEVPVYVTVTTEDDKIAHKLWLSKRVDKFELDVAKKPLLVRFDEGNYLLKEWTFEKSQEELLYQLKHDDVIGRAWAAKELGKRFQMSEVQAELKASATNDPFWFVRQSCVEALGGYRDKALITFLKEKALDEKSTVRVAALEALGSLEDAELVPFFRQRFEQDDSYRAQAEAIRSIGKCGDAASSKFLKKAARMDSPRDVIKKAAEGALAKIKEST